MKNKKGVGWNVSWWYFLHVYKGPVQTCLHGRFKLILKFQIWRRSGNICDVQHTSIAILQIFANVHEVLWNFSCYFEDNEMTVN